jgi:hypothetical protein
MRIPAVVLLVAACGGSTNYVATLSGANEVPANGSGGTGTATISVNGSSASYTIQYFNLSGNPTASHIHVGAAGVAGPVVVPFANLPQAGSGTISGTFTSSDIKPQTNPPVTSLDDLVAQMKAGNAYVNIHSAANLGGEIRGQLKPQ